jgi:hypothetical protein
MSRIPAKVRTQLHERAQGCCEICGKHGATNAHHRKNQSQGGQHVLSNLMLLCGSGTTGCHGWVTQSPRSADRLGWLVWSYENPAEKPVRMWAFRWALFGDDGSITLTTQNGVA